MTIAQILYPYTNCSINLLYFWAKNQSFENKKKIIEAYCGTIEERGNRRNKPGRGLRQYPIVFDLVGDFGIYRDLQRHRMLGQQRQLLSPYLGFDMPDEIKEAGLENEYLSSVETSRQLYELIKSKCGPVVAQYAVLFAFNIRWYMAMNHQEAFHMLELRTGKQGHPSYRKMCQIMHRELMRYDKLISPLMRFVDHDYYYWSRAESEAAQRRKEGKFE